jgi:hypothetical protein
VRAIVVRLHCHEAFPAGESEESHLYLFRLSGSSLEPVFDITTELRAIERGPGDDIEERSTLSVATSSDGGIFDLLLRRMTVIRPLFPDDAPARRPTTRVETERFSWDGQRYVLLPARRSR